MCTCVQVGTVRATRNNRGRKSFYKQAPSRVYYYVVLSKRQNTKRTPTTSPPSRSSSAFRDSRYPGRGPYGGGQKLKTRENQKESRNGLDASFFRDRYAGVCFPPPSPHRTFNVGVLTKLATPSIVVVADDSETKTLLVRQNGTTRTLDNGH